MNADIIINDTRNRLWQRIIFATAFRWGFYATATAALAVLAGKVMGTIWIGWYALPAAGLVIGLITGLFKRPSPEHTAIYIDRSTGQGNYFATLLYCLTKEQPNPVEDAFKHTTPTVKTLRIPYNLHYPLMFAVSLIIIFIIILAPVATTDTHGYARIDTGAGINPSVGPGKITSAGMTKLRKEIVQLLKDIEQGKLNPAAILEKVNGFVTAAGSVEELAEIKALLEKITTQIPQIYEPRITQIENEIDKKMLSATRTGRNGFSLIDTASGDSTGAASGATEPVTSTPTGAASSTIRITPPKTIEEIMRKPYWPAEYDEVVKRYFGDK